MRLFFAALRPALLLFPLSGLCLGASYRAPASPRIRTNAGAASVGALGSAFSARPSLPGANQVRAAAWSAPSAFSFAGAAPGLMSPALPGDAPLPASALPKPILEAAGAHSSAFAPAFQAENFNDPSSPSGSPRLSPESVAERSAQIFDGMAAAPAVHANLPGAESRATQAPAPPLGARALNRAVRLIITGPPGSGKGTYSQLLSREYGIPHISVGDLLRAYAKNHPELEALMSQGRLVSTELVLRVVRERLRQPDVVERGFILDGFPRRVVEAKALKAMLGKTRVDAVIALEVPQEELLRRILARGRADDNAEVFKERMRIYREDTLAAAELFRKGRTVIAPDVSGATVEANYAGLKARFDRWAVSTGLK